MVSRSAHNPSSSCRVAATHGMGTDDAVRRTALKSESAAPPSRSMRTGLGRGHLLRSVIVLLSIATALPLVGSDRQAGATTSPTQVTQMLLLTRADVPGDWVVDGGPSA